MKFYFSNLKVIKSFGYFLPFLVYTKFKINIANSATLHLSSRLRIGDKETPEASPNISSLILKENSTTHFGEGVVLGGGTFIFVKENANFKIGNNTYFTSDVHLECVNNIVIGDNCAISWGVTIIDDDHHRIVPTSPKNEVEKPKVIIGSKVWIGCNVTILKNTFIGNNSIVAAGSVVRGTFPDNVLIGGNPARILKTNVNWE